jgi:hypothetical protein
MKYYIDKNGNLIQHNTDTDVFRVRNTTDKSKTIIPNDQIDLSTLTRLKKTKFCEFVNAYFKSVRLNWVFEGRRYKNLDNFDSNGNSYGFKWTDLPLHEVDGYAYSGLKIVCHWGRVYYFICSGNYFPRGQLVEMKTLKIVQWADIKNCSPVFNYTTKKLA